MSSTPDTAQALPRILCVDDEPMVLRSLAASLRKYFEVTTTEDPIAALEILAHEPDIRAVVSDFRMPEMDGGELLRRVRDRFPTVVRILLSGAGADNVVKEPGLVFRSLAKPCRRETLTATIEEALAIQAQIAQPGEGD